MLRGGVGMSGPVKGINSLDSSADLLRDLLLLSAITNPRQLFSYPGPGMSATEPRECLPGPLATYMHTHPGTPVCSEDSQGPLGIQEQIKAFRGQSGR